MIKTIEMPFIDWCRRVVASEDRYVIVDTETTGMYGEVIDLAILDMKGTPLYNKLIAVCYTTHTCKRATRAVARAYFPLQKGRVNFNEHSNYNTRNDHND